MAPQKKSFGQGGKRTAPTVDLGGEDTVNGQMAQMGGLTVIGWIRHWNL